LWNAVQCAVIINKQTIKQTMTPEHLESLLKTLNPDAEFLNDLAEWTLKAYSAIVIQARVRGVLTRRKMK